MPKKRRRDRNARPEQCPCSSAKPYAGCCQPLHTGERAPADAVELMRSRFSAVSLGLGDYLWSTLHSQHEARANGQEAYQQAMERGRSGVRYKKLHILDQRPADTDGIAQVLFHAEITRLRRDHSVVELSSFVEEEGRLRYITGVMRRAAALGHGLDELTIEHWDCGHGHHDH
ncbi:MAG: YchJ family metal-binding protein [Myxococcales bacterium]|nr:YchJ family metal-binding protein [Myxococcales bacterium]